MPAIASQWIAVEVKDGTKFEYKANCFVTSEGEFTIEIHPDLKPVIYGVKKPSGVTVARARSDAAERVYCKQLQDGIFFLKECAKDLITVKEETERVIVYKAEFNLSFWEQPDGRIFPNGSGRDGAWTDLHFENKGTNSCNRTDIFSLGVCAAVFDKVTTKRASGNIVRYLDPKFEDDKEPGAMLNSFTTLDVETKGIGKEYCKTREMLYSDKAALFFHDVMLGLCALAKRIDGVIADESKLAKAIEAGSFKMLPPAK